MKPSPARQTRPEAPTGPFPGADAGAVRWPPPPAFIASMGSGNSRLLTLLIRTPGEPTKDGRWESRLGRQPIQDKVSHTGLRATGLSRRLTCLRAAGTHNPIPRLGLITAVQRKCRYSNQTGDISKETLSTREYRLHLVNDCYSNRCDGSQGLCIPVFSSNVTFIFNYADTTEDLQSRVNAVGNSFRYSACRDLCGHTFQPLDVQWQQEPFVRITKQVQGWKV